MEQRPDVILAVDLGTSGVKTALITVYGQVLGWEAEPVALILTPDQGVEQRPDDWWNSLARATRRLLARGLVETSQVRAVCCSTQGEGTLPVDKAGRPLMNCILWMDMRGAPYLQAQARGRVNVMGCDPRKLLRWIRLTGGMPSLTGKDPAAHMLLVRERFPEIYAQTDKFLNVPDYINLRLSGRCAATVDSILTSWVTDNRRPDSIHYDPGLVRDSGIEAEKFPEIVACTQVLGKLRPEAAEALGLSTSVQVVAGSIDTTAAAIGAGAVADYRPHLYIGTSAWIAAHVPFKKTDPLASLASVPCAVPGRYLLIAMQTTAGGNLVYLRDNILYHKDELLQDENLPDVFALIDRIAGRIPPGSNGVVYTPWLWGERAPVEDRTLRAGLYNLSLNNTREDILRAFLEGVAFNTRWLMAPVQRFLGRPLEALHLAGGGGKSDVWCQIFADVLGLRVRQVQDPIQANARGAAFIAAVGLGAITFSDVERLTPIQRTFEPDAENRALYDERFEVFTQIYRQMKGIYRRLNG